MKKALIIAATTIALTGVSYSKQLHLDCEAKTTEGRSNIFKIMIDPTSNAAAVSSNIFFKDPNWNNPQGKEPKGVYPSTTGASDKLYTDGTYYWFSIPNRNYSPIKISLNRNDLTVITTEMSPNPTGTCKIVEAPKTKI